jgi:hypothetical protein
MMSTGDAGAILVTVLQGVLSGPRQGGRCWCYTCYSATGRAEWTKARRPMLVLYLLQCYRAF